MATQIIILPGDSIVIDQQDIIEWADRGNAMPAIPDTVHCVLWNNLSGQNEIQSKNASTGMMTGNTNLNATSDAVGSTTIAALLTWADTRMSQIHQARSSYDTAVADDEANGTSNAAGKTWRDYDPNYS
tara:strand:- start:2424 stop:2810 length:387 start_codon:yes stop_codon:yes gene_type:complete